MARVRSRKSVNSKKTENVETIRSPDRLLFFGFLTLIALLALAFTTITADQFSLPKFVILQSGTLILVAWWIIGLLTSERTEIRRTHIDSFVLLLFLLVLISTALSLNFPMSLLGKYNRHEGLLTLTWYLSLFFLSVQIFHNSGRITLYLKALVLAAAAISVYGTLQYFGIDIFNWTVARGSVAGQSISTFGNRSFLAGFLVAVLPSAFALFLCQKSWRRILVFGVLSLLILVSLLFTFSRGAWIGAAVGLPFFLAFSWRSLSEKKQHLRILSILLLVTIALAVVLGSQLGPELSSMLKRAGSAFEPATGSAAIRSEIWKSSLGIIAARPLTGTGPDAFRLLFPRFQTLRYTQLSGGQSIADDAHNYFLQIASTMGLPALAVLVAIILLVFSEGIGLGRTSGGDERLILGALLGGVLAYLTHLLFTVSNIASTAWLWTVLGAISGQASSRRGLIVRGRGLSLTRKAIIIAIAGVMLVTGLVLTSRIFLADIHYAKAQSSSRQRNLDDAVQEFERAIRLHPFLDVYPREMGVTYFDFSRATGNVEAYEKAVEAFQRAIEMNPNDSENNLLLAETLTFGGKEFDPRFFDDALDALTRCLRLRPYSSVAYYLLGEVSFLKGETDEAVRYLQMATEIDPQFTQAREFLGFVSRQKATQSGGN